MIFGAAVQSLKTAAPVEMLLTEFNGIHMRKDPPFDMDYICATWLLESARQGPRFFNSPWGLRGINEKLSILRFPWAIQPALVSADPQKLLDFIDGECGGDAILKPLMLYSGKGILRINIHDGKLTRAALLAQLKAETGDGRYVRLLQPFNQAIFAGEVRAFTIGGKALAWCLKKPAPGQFMANSSFHSTRHAYTPTAQEKACVEKIATELLQDGITVIGYDLIGGFVSEINVTSPRLLVGDDDTRDYFSDFAGWVESASRR